MEYVSTYSRTGAKAHLATCCVSRWLNSEQFLPPAPGGPQLLCPGHSDFGGLRGPPDLPQFMAGHSSDGSASGPSSCQLF